MANTALSTTKRSAAFAQNLLVFTLICSLLYFGRPVLMPLALAILVTFLLSPITRRLEKLRVPSVVAVVTTVTLAAGVIGVIGYFMGKQVMALAADLPKHQKNIVEKIADVKSASSGGALDQIQDTIDRVSEQVETLDAVEESKKYGPPVPPEIRSKEPAAEPPPPVEVRLAGADDEFTFLGLKFPQDLAPVGEMLATTGLVSVLVIFMLLQRKDLRNRLIGLAGRANLAVTTTALNEAGKRIARYLLMQFLLNCGYGTCTWIGLYFLKVPYAPLWGLGAAVLRYLPYVGAWLAALLPISVSLIMQSGWDQVFSVVGLFLVLELISNNVFEPKLYGHTVGISEVAIIVSAVVWVFLWGPVGLVLATPMTVCLVVISSHVPALEFVGHLIGERHQLEPQVQFYQRLLSQDEDEAVELFVSEANRSTPVEASDRVIVPALVLAQKDRHGGSLDEEDIAFISAAVEDLADDIREIREKAEDAPVAPPANSRPVLVFPVNGRLDHAALTVLATLMEEDGCPLRVLQANTLSSELIAQIREIEPLAVLFGALAPASFAHTRRLLKRIHIECPDLPILAGLWSPRKLKGSRRDAAQEVGARDAFSSFAEARAYLRQLMQTDRAR